ncbi:hypothetical protein JKF63_05106 [Porcisia hertigi]|uniref:Uncharacterized protein n=1 Tax=Porcisia hertigi TaxID=2761500 RepID=A0A836IJF4_9TRYP|nr:hypothetical protein JKF63_05106 [Porcisia hertigi]
MPASVSLATLPLSARQVRLGASAYAAPFTSCTPGAQYWQCRAAFSISRRSLVPKRKKAPLSKGAEPRPATAASPAPPLYPSHAVRTGPATTSKSESKAQPTAAPPCTAGVGGSLLADANIDTLSPASSPSPEVVAANHGERLRRSYTPTNAAISEQLASLRRELLEVRLQLAKAEETNAGLYEGVLARLAETDRAAHLTASSIRYTGMALRAAHDNLEVELRRLLTIGLTAEEVDAAAIEAGARQYVRQNIGYHSEHVSSKPSAVPDMTSAVKGNELSKTMKAFSKSKK